jgi:hypothetical protein
MGKVNKKKFYRPGTLEVKGTKITLKTLPYTNGVVFDMEDPISSFRAHVALIQTVIDNYEYIMNIPGFEVLGKDFPIRPEDLGKLKLFLNYLVESPIEITLKEQELTNDILRDLEVANG